MRRGGRRIGTAASLVTLAICLVAARPVRAQLTEAPLDRGVVLGRVCVDTNGDGRCGKDEPGLADVEVRTATGLTLTTDADGRYHLAAIPGRVAATTPSGVPLERLVHLVVSVDASRLGPGARAPSPVWIDLVPGAVHHLDLPVRLPKHAAERAIVTGPGAGAPPTARRRKGTLVYGVPARVGRGHTVLVAGKPVPVDRAGRVHLPVVLAGREGRVTVVDRAPDGRTRIALAVVLRVPRPSGGDLVQPLPLASLAVLDLPASGQTVAPGLLAVPVRAPKGTKVTAGGRSTTVGPGGSAVLFARVEKSPLEVTVARAGTRAQVSVPLTVSASAPPKGTLALDARGGISGTTPFGEGRLTGFGELPLLGGRLSAGVDLDDASLSQAISTGQVLTLRRPDVLSRWPDPVVDGAVFGDASVTRDANPAGLSLYAAWRGPAGTFGLGTARTGLDGGEVGRFDRPVVGPYADLHARLGPVTVRLEAAGDASATPVAEPTGLVPAHLEIDGTGGSVYWLGQTGVAEGSERIFVELVDPRTGLVASRRLLTRGTDYDLDYASGRLVLVAPLGLEGAPPTGRLGELGLGWRTVLVVDDAIRPPPGTLPDTASGAARLSVRGGGVTFGLRAAAVNAGRYGLIGADLDAHPVSWLSVSGSVARSRGTPFAPGMAVVSRDGGLSFGTLKVMPIDPPGFGNPKAPTGNAAALRLRLGDPKHTGIVLWGRVEDAGFADGTVNQDWQQLEVGGLGHLSIGPVRLSLEGDRHLGADPRPSYPGRVTLVDLSARAEVDVGPLTVALEGDRTVEDVMLSGDSGSRTAAGLGLTLHLGRVALEAGRLQGIARSGTGPAAIDPTFTSVGAKLDVGKGRHLELRAGLHDDGRPAGVLRWIEPRADGERYAGFAARTDGPWSGQGVSSVSGGRSVVAPGVSVYAESRVSTGNDAGGVAGDLAAPAGGTNAVSGTGGTSGTDAAGGATIAPASTGNAVGGTVARGPLHLSLAYERACRLDDPTGAVRDAASGRIGWAVPRLSASAFGEVVRGWPTAGGRAFERQWAAGLSATATPIDSLSLGTRFVISHAFGAGDAGAAYEGFADAIWRPASGGPDVLAQYGIREDRRATDGLRHRLHLGRIGVVLGGWPGPELTLTGRLAVDQLLAPVATAGRALVGSVRLGWPIAGRFEPVVELGVRRTWGAGAPDLVDATARIEALVRLGPLRVGVGAVLAGFAGTGLETASGQPVPPRIYLVLRGAL